MKILVYNGFCYHYEIVASLMHNVIRIMQWVGYPVPNQSPLLLEFCIMTKKPDQGFVRFLKTHFPRTSVITLSRHAPTKLPLSFFKFSAYDFHIDATAYPRHRHSMCTRTDVAYVLHELEPWDSTRRSNCIALLPNKLGYRYIDPTFLPFTTGPTLIKARRRVSRSSKPTLVVQGNLDPKRRDFGLLGILMKQKGLPPFDVKLVGRGTLPPSLEPYRSRLSLRTNLEFLAFHKELLAADAILSLSSKRVTPQYYHGKLTSNITYARAYGIPCVLDQDLQHIHNLDLAFTYGGKRSFVDAVKKALLYLSRQRDVG